MSKDIKSSIEKTDEAIERLFHRMADDDGVDGLNAAIDFLESSTDDTPLRTDMRKFMNKFRDADNDGNKIRTEVEDEVFLDAISFILKQCGVMFYQGFKFGNGYSDAINAKKINEIVINQLKELAEGKKESSK